MLFVLKMRLIFFFIFVHVAHKKKFGDDFLPHPPEVQFFLGGGGSQFFPLGGQIATGTLKFCKGGGGG